MKRNGQVRWGRVVFVLVCLAFGVWRTAARQFEQSGGNISQLVLILASSAITVTVIIYVFMTCAQVGYLRFESHLSEQPENAISTVFLKLASGTVPLKTLAGSDVRWGNVLAAYGALSLTSSAMTVWVNASQPRPALIIPVSSIVSIEAGTASEPAYFYRAVLITISYRGKTLTVPFVPFLKVENRYRAMPDTEFDILVAKMQQAIRPATGHSLPQ